MKAASWWAGTALLFRRNVREGLRSPAFAFLFPTALPLFMLIFIGESLREIVNLPVFPVSPYAAFIAPAIVLLAAMMGAGHSATGLVADARSGFLDRLRLVPLSPVAVLTSRVAFDLVRVLPAGVVVLAAAAAFGARMEYGPASWAGLLGLLALWSVAYNGIFYVVAIATRNAQAPLALLPMFMPLLFVSSAFVPTELLPPWLEALASWNPFAYLVEGARAITTGPFAWGPVGRAIAAALVVGTWTYAEALRGLRGLVAGD